MMKRIVLAGGCFWGVQAYFDKVNGVLNTVTGYTEGDTENPSYEDVCNGSGHAEAIYLEYDELKTTLDTILKHYFNIIDPTLINRQGNDIGLSYRTGIFCYQKEDLEYVKKFVDSIRDQYELPIVTEMKMLSHFYKAEAYHQNYLVKHPGGYCHINLKSINNIQKASRGFFYEKK